MSKPTFSPQNSTLLLIDHQVGTTGWVRSVFFETMKRHAITLARAAAATGMPVALTSGQEERAQGPLLPELEKILPKEFAARIKRAGIVNCWKDPAFAAAAKAPSRKETAQSRPLVNFASVRVATTNHFRRASTQRLLNRRRGTDARTWIAHGFGSADPSAPTRILIPA